ncbi:MAG: hypothetical protein HY905_06850 [Deltaproteobacteria bacterium]|nr:hypothetical protein [Deltaproteobacteria bacterium]
MACYLLTETMNRRHELAMTSYDRLFPNQDTMPKGGFGNLIALPLQSDRVKDGNTVFLDDRLVPFPDHRRFSPERRASRRTSSSRSPPRPPARVA